MPPAKKTSSAQNTTLPSMAMDVITQYPGPLTVSRAANVESVFSGAGKFTDEAKSAGPTLSSRIVKLHYNWKYKLLRPTMKAVIARYNA